MQDGTLGFLLALLLAVPTSGEPEDLRVSFQDSHIVDEMRALAPSFGNQLDASPVTRDASLDGRSWDELPQVLQLTSPKGKALTFLKLEMQGPSEQFFQIVEFKIENRTKDEASFQVGAIRFRRHGEDESKRTARLFAAVGVGQGPLFFKRTTPERDLAAQSKVSVPASSTLTIRYFLANEPLEWSFAEGEWHCLETAASTD